jgi:ribosomal protein S6--L-glutamate ligase
VTAFVHQDLESQFSKPFVIKRSQGGEGDSVYLVSDQPSLHRVLDILLYMEKEGFGPFLIQEFVPNDHRDMRVVVIGDKFYAYWRRQPDTDQFLHSTTSGAIIDHQSDPHLIDRGQKLAESFSRLSCANLTALDLMFPLGSDRPMLIEVNYYFGRRGLGGTFNYYQLLKQAVTRWLDQVRKRS